MFKQQVRTAKAPAPAGAYSQALIAGGMLYTAGVSPHDPASGEIVGEGIAGQTHQVMRNLGEILAEAGLSFAHVVKTTAHLHNLEDFSAFNAVYESYVEVPYPVRTTVGSTLAGFLVEVDLVAALDSDRTS